METEQGRVAVHEKQLTQADFVEWLYATLWAGPGKGFLLVLAVCLGLILVLAALSVWAELGLSWRQLWPAGLCVLAAVVFAVWHAALDRQATLPAVFDYVPGPGHSFQAHGVLPAVFGD